MEKQTIVTEMQTLHANCCQGRKNDLPDFLVAESIAQLPSIKTEIEQTPENSETMIAEIVEIARNEFNNLGEHIFTFFLPKALHRINEKPFAFMPNTKVIAS